MSDEYDGLDDVDRFGGRVFYSCVGRWYVQDNDGSHEVTAADVLHARDVGGCHIMRLDGEVVPLA